MKQFQLADDIIKFWKVPPIKKIVYTSKDISKFNGNYYIRVFGEGDNKYAKKINPNKKFLPGMGTRLVSEYDSLNTLFKEKSPSIKKSR